MGKEKNMEINVIEYAINAHFEKLLEAVQRVTMEFNVIDVSLKSLLDLGKKNYITDVLYEEYKKKRYEISKLLEAILYTYAESNVGNVDDKKLIETLFVDRG